MDSIRDNLDQVRHRMALAAERAGRRPDDVLLVAVTKTVGAEIVRELAALGVTDIGEGRVQDAQHKADALGGKLGLRWHMIGHLQTNKVRFALHLFDRIHSLDSHHLAAEIDRRAAAGGLAVQVLIEVNTGGEETKFGVAPDGVLPLIDAIRPLGHVRVEGLMTMAPYVATSGPLVAGSASGPLAATVGSASEPLAATASRPFFARLRELAEQARAATGLPLPHLSMGMTQDFEVAIEEGATMVRVGSALFRGL